MSHINSNEGLLYYLINKIRPELAKRIKENKSVETAVIGLGRQGTKHAGLMREYGTNVAAGIAPGKGGTRVHEIIPVYDGVNECMREHPNIAAVSIWRHYSTARDAAIEAIESGIPIVVLISEGIPLRDVRDILVAAKKHKILLIGGNTPGIIFPPEGIKIGMLPDIFYPEERTPGSFGPKGVTIISRSGAILYHMSDALASAGIAQNGVIGIGGDGAIGSTFIDLVPLVMGYENTDLVVIAGEIGGCQEERLAADIKAHPEKYPKPIVAIISGAHAPEGKTMGHAGAIVAPGQAYGTFKSKRDALEAAGVTVVNSQYDLIGAVKKKLGKSYFDISRYYDKMRTIWEAPPKKSTWGTLITKVVPNNLIISGYPLKEIIGRKDILDTSHLLVRLEFPDSETLKELNRIALDAAHLPVTKIESLEGEDISKTLSKYLLLDTELAKYPQKGMDGQVKKTVFCLGRMAGYLAVILGNEGALQDIGNEKFSNVIYRAITGEKQVDEKRARMLEAMIVASVDHGVTPPSTQATLIASSTRAPFEISVAHGVGVITDVHGGAGAKAARFFSRCIALSQREGKELDKAITELMTSYIKSGKRIEGLGHRVHTHDPRRDVLWKLSEESGIAGEHVKVSKMLSGIFKQVRGMDLPINVDGVIGAIVADMGLDPSIAKALFIYGRVAGLSAHYFEEIISQPQMRRINFTNAVYKGKEERHLKDRK